MYYAVKAMQMQQMVCAAKNHAKKYTPNVPPIPSCPDSKQCKCQFITPMPTYAPSKCPMYSLLRLHNFLLHSLWARWCTDRHLLLRLLLHHFLLTIITLPLLLNRSNFRARDSPRMRSSRAQAPCFSSSPSTSRWCQSNSCPSSLRCEFRNRNSQSCQFIFCPLFLSRFAAVGVS